MLGMILRGVKRLVVWVLGYALALVVFLVLLYSGVNPFGSDTEEEGGG